jgi:hypothetical protein
MKIIDISDKEARDDLAKLSARRSRSSLQAARGKQTLAGGRVERRNAAARFLLAGAARPRNVKALDTYWISAAEPD